MQKECRVLCVVWLQISHFKLHEREVKKNGKTAIQKPGKTLRKLNISGHTHKI